MDNVFDLYVVNRDQPFRTAMLTLPASIYEMVDAVERVTSKTMARRRWRNCTLRSRRGTEENAW